MRVFLYDLISALDPFKYPHITLRSPFKGFAYMFKLVLFFTIILSLFYIPEVADIPHALEKQVSKIKISDVNGKFQVTEPIRFPEQKPIIIVDTNVDEPSESVMLFFSKNSLFYNGNKSAYSAFLDMSKPDKNIVSFLRLIVFLIAPSLFFYLFLLFFVKYFIISLALALLIASVLDLTSWAVSWKKSLNLAFFASTWSLPLEILLSPFKIYWLGPILTVGKFTLYALPIFIYLIFAVFALVCIIRYQQEKTNIDIP
ncbi:DUF1189 family protein [Candidatus Woesearchaeota archaeon]|nr:DUF1189 family protein [Candidatus Woesearchaeota archaeon]